MRSSAAAWRSDPRSSISSRRRARPSPNLSCFPLSCFPKTTQTLSFGFIAGRRRRTPRPAALPGAASRLVLLGGGVHDLHRLHLVADPDLVDHVHAGGDDAEDRVLAVEEVGGGEHDVELAPRGIGVIAPRHGHRAADVLLLVELRLDLVAGPAHAIALGIAPLDDEA